MKEVKEVVQTGEIAKPKEKKSFGFVWGFIAGAFVQLIILGLTIRPSFPMLQWVFTHQDETKWAMDRYTMIQKASHVLYFEDEMTGVTIVKPQMMK